MKKLLIAVLVVSGLIGVYHFENNYTRKDCVAVEATETGVIFKDQCGFTWYWEEEGFEVGDVVDMKMHTNYTMNNIDDDEIKKVVRAD